ncbi:MAG: NAD+ synthase [Saprospiraceae bacterium]
MRIAIAQLNYHIGNFHGNVDKMINAVEWAENQNADLICFGELAISGYPPRDFLEFDDFIKKCETALSRLKKASKQVAIIVGCPSRNPVVEGKDLYNSAYVLYQDKVHFKQNKTLLPTYDVFDEYRYFEPNSTFSCFDFKGKKIALTICEDIWNVGNDNPLYTISPLDKLIKEDPDFILNISASPFSYNHAEERIDVIRANVRRYKKTIFYSNNVGANTELIFDGGSVVMNQDGVIVDELPYFQEEMKVYDLDSVIACQKSQEQEKDDISEIYQALILGVKDYFGKLGFKKAIIGLSGGIDSAVTTVIAAQALGAENVRVLMMPSQYSSDHSINDAKELAENLGIQYDLIKISDIYHSFKTELYPVFGDLPFNVAEENLQARTRGVLLMAMSNKFGNIVLNTSNKSEAAVGYGTLYGDMCGGLSVIGDVYKTQVFALANHINNNKEIIPINTITKPPSAELRPNQKDSDSLPEYEILDQVLYEYIENKKGPQEIIDLGFDPTLVKKILRLMNINEFKRFQTAPTLRVSSKAFGMGRRMPIVGKYLS